jgi:hypothetical protein
MRRTLVVTTVSAFLLLAACSSSNTASSSSTTSAESGEVTAVTIPDAFTPLVFTPISDPTFPWQGSDQKWHVSYDLQITNGTHVPATLTKVEVVDAHDPSRIVGTIAGTQLVDPACPYGDCNRLRMLPGPAATDTTIPPQESRALLVDLTFGTKAESPTAVLHHVYVDGASGPPAKTPTPLDYYAAPFDTSAGTPRVIGSPLHGTNWVAANGCCGTGWPHRTALITVDGKLQNSQRFAIDWLRLTDDGRFYSGDKTKNESYASYDQNIYAVADGTIVSTLDDVGTNAPGVLPANDPVLAPKLNVTNVDGNHIIQDIGGGLYAMYAHLIPHSMTVKAGDKVKKGEVIGKLGNTGNSNAAHLHFQIMNDPVQFRSDGIPYAIDSFTYKGQVPEAGIANADDYLTGTFNQQELAEGEPRTDQLPTLLAIVSFSG